MAYMTYSDVWHDSCLVHIHREWKIGRAASFPAPNGLSCSRALSLSRTRSLSLSLTHKHTFSLSRGLHFHVQRSLLLSLSLSRARARCLSDTREQMCAFSLSTVRFARAVSLALFRAASYPAPDGFSLTHALFLSLSRALVPSLILALSLSRSLLPTPPLPHPRSLPFTHTLSLLVCSYARAGALSLSPSRTYTHTLTHTRIREEATNGSTREK